MANDLAETKKEEQLQNDLMPKIWKAKTSKDYFETAIKESARPLCVTCHAIIRLFEMTSFNKNGGHCTTCSAFKRTSTF